MLQQIREPFGYLTKNGKLCHVIVVFCCGGGGGGCVVIVVVGAMWRRVHAIVYTWQAVDNFHESVLSFHLAKAESLVEIHVMLGPLN